MTRVLVVAIALVSWLALIGASLVMMTPDEEAGIVAATQAELDAQVHTLAAVAGDMERELLAAVRETTLVLRPGVLIERSAAAEAPVKGKKKPVKGAILDAPLGAEQAKDFMRTLEADVTDVVLRGAGARWAALVASNGDVVMAAGDGGWPVGAQVKNHPLVVDAMMGLSRVAALHGANHWIIAAAPTLGRDGGANGVLVFGRAIDTAFCTELSTALNGLPLALGRPGQVACKTDALPQGALSPGMTVIASGLDSPLLFIDAANVGTAIWTVEKVVPVAELNASVGRDNRPAYMRLSAWQQRVIAVWMLGLVPLLILLVLTWLMAVAPAQQIANYLALLQQGSKVAPLSERKFSGGFKRIVKNLNTVLERKEGRSPQSLAPISQLLQQQAREEISGEFKLDAIDGPTANKQVPPAQLQALRDAADKPMERTEIALPPVQPLQTPREPPTPMKAPLSPLSSGLSALSDSIFEDDKSVTSKLNASDIAELRGAAAQKPIEKPVVFEEMPLPAAAVINPQPNAGISKLESLSDSETESGLGALSEMLPAAPSQRPWPESTATVIAPMPAMPAPAALDPDDAHFQEVFQQFLKVREQCGEPTNNLTYDKFVEKLKKSRDQVMQKQQTRNVRFQVYVKDGKAALKAVAAGRSS